MSNTTRNLSLPEEMDKWITKRSELANYSGVSEYIRDLVKQDQNQIGHSGRLNKPIIRQLVKTKEPA